MINYGRQYIDEADIAAVEEVLRSDFLTQGYAVPRFEEAMQARSGAAHAVAFSSATSALHVACLSLGLGVGDWLWTSPITFVASANCGLYCGAQVDFVDIDPSTFNLCPNALARKLVQAQALGRLPKVVVVVHMCGQPCDMEEIRRLSLQYGFRIIEDASHAVGARYRDEPVGNCRYSDITIFSFHPVKIITTGEGGLLTTQDADIAEIARLLRSHGITRNPVEMTEPPEGDWVYQQIALGFNYRMTDIQAALGVSQADKLDGFLERRRGFVRKYEAALADLPLILPAEKPDRHSSWHLYVVRLKEGSERRKEVFSALRAQGIGVNVHYQPVYQQPYYQRMGFKPEEFPESEAYYRSAITLPLYAAMTQDQHDTVIRAVREVVLT